MLHHASASATRWCAPLLGAVAMLVALVVPTVGDAGVHAGVLAVVATAIAAALMMSLSESGAFLHLGSTGGGSGARATARNEGPGRLIDPPLFPVRPRAPGLV